MPATVNELFGSVTTLPNRDAQTRYEQLVGLDPVKERLEKEAEVLLRPDLLEKWSREQHGTRLAALDVLARRPPLFLFAGDVGTGKTELATTFGDRLARQAHFPTVQLYSLSLSTRGSGAVGEMTRLITEAFAYLRAHGPKAPAPGKKPSGAAILLIDEADALAQSREMAQMHHEDRAGVNALIRGIDDIANAKLPCLILMCSNRLGALDPAVLRRAAAVFEFQRPGLEMRTQLLATHLAGAGLGSSDLTALAESLGATAERPYGYTFSDITQRLIPSLVLSAYPTEKITRALALRVAAGIPPTPPFKAQ
jgi:SpoVK/Ycf46/Vps4 family AAA+-type ATPase